jgi:hypothetical protein
MTTVSYVKYAYPIHYTYHNHRLLSPQHWAQESCDTASNDNSTWCATHKDRVVLYWNLGKYKRMIQIDKTGPNTAIMWTAPGTNRFSTYMNHIQQPVCLSTNITQPLSQYPAQSSISEPTTDNLTYQHTTTEPSHDTLNMVDFDIYNESHYTTILPQ